MFQVNKECAETVTEFLKNYKQQCMPLIASLIVKENRLKVEFNQNCNIGNGQLCNYLKPESESESETEYDPTHIYRYSRESSLRYDIQRANEEYLRNYKQLFIHSEAPLIVKENHLKLEYNHDYSFQTRFSLDYSTYIGLFSEYERRAFESSLGDESPRKIIYSLQIIQHRERWEDYDLLQLPLDKGHYYSLLIQKINYKLKAIRENKTVEQPELWSDLLKL
jgi:hypothetical protein